MRSAAAASPATTAARFSAIERLGLGLLVAAEYDGGIRWIQVQADDIADLGGELRVR